MKEIDRNQMKLDRELDEYLEERGIGPVEDAEERIQYLESELRIEERRRQEAQQDAAFLRNQFYNLVTSLLTTLESDEAARDIVNDWIKG